MMRRTKLIAGGAATTVLLGAMLALEAGCYDRNVCDGGGAADWGLNPEEGQLISGDVWETTPQVSRWLPFPRRRVWLLHPKGLEGRGYARVNVYVSADPDPNVIGTQYTTGAGNLGQIRVAGDLILVINETCEDYFVRVVVEAYPGAPDAGALAPPPAPPEELPDAGDDDASDGA